MIPRPFHLDGSEDEVNHTVIRLEFEAYLALGAIKAGMLTIETTRYSKVVAAFVQRYPDAVAKVDKRTPDGPTSGWCTNANLLSAINLSLRRGSTELLGFHDGPRNMWASAETLPLVEELAAQKLLRYKISAPPRPSLFSRLFGWSNGA